MLSGVPVFAQNGQAESADDFLAGKQTPATSAPQSQASAPQSTAPKSAQEIELENSLAEAKAELDDEVLAAKKLELAKQMHKIRPTREQIDAAVMRAASLLPQYDRRNFMNAMKTMLNYNAIERISIDSMVETYTVKELESMVAYYSLPEARTASMKVVFWGNKVQPEIARMIDRAMMRIRTGQ